MRNEYDLKKTIKNPYASQLNKQITFIKTAMLKSYLYITVVCLFSGCGTTVIRDETNFPSFSAEATKFLRTAQSAIVAYQNRDTTTWEKLVCQNPSKHTLELTQEFIGKYENVHLVAVKDKWSAANKPPYPLSMEVVFEGIASNYPMPDHKMAVTFVDIEKGCLYLMF